MIFICITPTSCGMGFGLQGFADTENIWMCIGGLVTTLNSTVKILPAFRVLQKQR